MMRHSARIKGNTSAGYSCNVFIYNESGKKQNNEKVICVKRPFHTYMYKLTQCNAVPLKQHYRTVYH